MYLVKRRIYAGCTLEIQTYLNDRRVRSTGGSEPNPRFKNDEDRKEFMLARSRRKFIRMVNENFTPQGFYCTFTCDRKHECHTIEEIRKLWNRFWRRMRRKHPGVKMVGVPGRNGSAKDEKGNKKRDGDKFHVHMMIEGVSKEEIEKEWIYGNARVDQLWEHVKYDGVDHGPDYTKLAEYMIDHWAPEQGPRKWKATRNLRRPETEIETEMATLEMKRQGGDCRIPETPEGYIFIEAKQTKYGFSSYMYVLDPRQRQREIKNNDMKRRQKRKQDQKILR